MEGDPDTDNWTDVADWGIDPRGGKDLAAVRDWQLITAWQHVTFYKAPGGLVPCTTQIIAPSETMTLFIQLFKKPPKGYTELNLDLDGLSLFGPKTMVVTQP